MMQKNIIYKSLSLVWMCFILISCSKTDDTYKEFVGNGEIIYIGKADSVKTFSGYNRIKLSWLLNADPKIDSYVVLWNNRQDSVIVSDLKNNVKNDTVNVIIEALKEGNYNFEIISRDQLGNRSVTASTTGKVYGTNYTGNLLNKGVAIVGTATTAALNWGTVENAIGVKFTYENADGQLITGFAKTNDTRTELPSWKVGSELSYQTMFLPERALDTFYAPIEKLKFPPDFMLDKSKFKRALLPGDITGANYGGGLEKLWNNVVAANDWYHSNADGGGDRLPHLFTVDLGVVANLSSMRLYPIVECCTERTPRIFEIWGIADTTNAVPRLAVTDPGWKLEAKNKGWILLLREERKNPVEGTVTDPLQINIPAHSGVRFIRYRLEETWASDHISSLTEWDIRSTKARSN